MTDPTPGEGRPLTERLEQLRHNCEYHREVNCMVAAADVLELFAQRDALTRELDEAVERAETWERQSHYWKSVCTTPVVKLVEQLVERATRAEQALWDVKVNIDRWGLPYTKAMVDTYFATYDQEDRK